MFVELSERLTISVQIQLTGTFLMIWYFYHSSESFIVSVQRSYKMFNFSAKICSTAKV